MKPLEELCKPDIRSTMMSYCKPNPDGSEGEWKRLDLEYHYGLAKECSLPDEAPESIRVLWEVAQNLLVYSFYEYSFVVVADLYCSMTVEAALRLICKVEINEYHKDREAKQKGLRDPDFSEVLKMFKRKTLEVLTEGEAHFLYERLSALRKVRAIFVHPKGQTLHPITTSMMIRTSEWLGAYYHGKLKELVIVWMRQSEIETERFKQIVKAAKNNEL